MDIPGLDLALTVLTEAMPYYFGIIAGATVIKIAILYMPKPDDRTGIQMIRTWNIKTQKRNLAALRHGGSFETQWRSKDDVIKLDTIYRAVAYGEWGQRCFWRVIRILRNLGALDYMPFYNPPRTIRRILFSPISWIAAVSIVLYKNSAERDRLSALIDDLMHGFDVKIILSSSTSAIVLSAVILALFGAVRIDRLRARDEAGKAANTELLALGSDLVRLEDAIETYTEELARWRSIALDKWVRDVTGDRYRWCLGLEMNRADPIRRAIRIEVGEAPSNEELRKCCEAVIARSNSISIEGTSFACKNKTRPIWREANGLKLFNVRLNTINDFPYDIVLGETHADMKEQQKYFDMYCKGIHPSLWDPSNNVSDKDEWDEKSVKEKQERFERYLVESAYTLLYKMDIRIQQLITMHIHASRAANFLINRASIQTTDQALYKALRG